MASFDPTKPSTPISFPISELADLESGAYYRSFHFPFNKAFVPLPESAASAMPDRRRILVCHDMMGGYVDDKWVQGGDNADAYAIWQWYLMDVFVYFSHNLVTIPPPCWTNAGHTHGVKVLGTFIIEWEKGAEICKTLLATEESARMYAGKLAELASALGFDGWLINIEVDYLDKKQIVNLKEFVGHLTQVIHKAVRGSLIIWYDSVTVDGWRDYQNQLNEKNKPFFNLCDGIYVNYFWRANGVKISASFAGSRRHDVYMGIDVWGRGTYGGGGWDTNVALDLLREDDISAAVFAPGWVYEHLPKADFQSNQYRFKDDSYSGGGNITCKGSFRDDVSFASRLFQGQLPMGDLPLTFSYSVKSDGNSRIGLLLQLVSDAYKPVFILLADDDASVDKLTDQCGKVEHVPVKKTRIEGAGASWILHETSIAKNGYTITGISLYCYMGKQDQEEPRLEDSSLYSASLGHISIQNFAEYTRFPPANSWSIHLKDISVSNDPNGSRTVSLTIIWNQKEENAKPFTKYNIYVEKLGNEAGGRDFLGVAAVERFYASDLEYPVGIIGLKFIVQPCGSDGICQELVDCPALVYAQ